MNPIRAWAATAAGGPLVPFAFDPGPLGAEDVEVAIESCGVCHSDLSMLRNEWGRSAYPLVAGHEVAGHVVALGSAAKGLRVGERVGIGWYAGSCMHCGECIGGDQHLCRTSQATIIGHHGGFAERVRAHWAWTIPLPDGLDASSAGPLLCGGITVFSPLIEFGVRATDRVGVVGIGGLGHLALKFARAWGCEVTAFTSSATKRDAALAMGAHHAASSRDSNALRALAGRFDLILVTANVTLDWRALLAALAPRGRLHVVGGVLEPMPIPAFALIDGQKQVSGSPTGSPRNLARMLDFAARHRIAPTIERFPMSRINEALAHLAAGKARYRVVLEADFG